MKIEDIKSVHLLEKECFSMPWSEKSLESEVNKKDALFCIWEENGKIAGYAGMYFVCGEGDITNVAVFSDYRRCGIAEKILKGMFEIAYKQGINEFTLEVRKSNEIAIKLYEKLGFVIEGTRKNFYDNLKEDGLIMWKR